MSEAVGIPVSSVSRYLAYLKWGGGGVGWIIGAYFIGSSHINIDPLLFHITFILLTASIIDTVVVLSIDG